MFPVIGSRDFQRQADIVDGCSPGQEDRVLEDEAELIGRLGFSHRTAADFDMSGRREQQSADAQQERRLPATGGADEGEKLPLLDIEGDVFDR